MYHSFHRRTQVGNETYAFRNIRRDLPLMTQRAVKIIPIQIALKVKLLPDKYEQSHSRLKWFFLFIFSK